MLQDALIPIQEGVSVSKSEGSKNRAYVPDADIKIWPVPFFSALFHLLALFRLIFIRPTNLALLIGMITYLLVGLGITIGYHRCLNHRAVQFKYRWLERIFVTLGALCLQGGPIWWCSLHRIHHQNSDTDHDPHDSRRGFFYSHIGFLAHLDKRWRYMHTPEQQAAFVRDIARDPYYVALDKYLLGTVIATLIWWGYYLLGGWPLFFWAGPIATVFTLNMTFLINSVTHKWGYVSFDTKDNSKNNGVVALLTHGEGWHNNHHAYPSSAKHGFFRWWEFDLSYLVLRLLKGLGGVQSLVKPREENPSISR